MLGKLFNLSAPGAPGVAGPSPHGHASSSRQVSPLESVQEDIHTRTLLFPDAQALYQHQNDQLFPLSSASALPPSTSTSNAFDLDGDLELESRHVRVIIMQDTLSSVPACLLYDSHPPPSVQGQATERPSTMAGLSHSTAQDARRVIPPRKASMGQSARPVAIQPDSPVPRQSTFDRRQSLHGRSQSRVETESQRAMREYKQEIDTFSSCIFGNNEFLAYKGTSTKVHVVPSDLRNDSWSSVIGDGRGSVGRSAIRSSKLAQTFSSVAPPSFSQSASSPVPRPADRRKVLITRLFPVNLPNDDHPIATPQGQCAEDSTGFPFPQSSDELRPKPKKDHPKQKRTPMYAVALIISLPQNPPSLTPASASKTAFRGSNSYTEQDSFPSSYNSAGRSGWTMLGHPSTGLDAFDSALNLDTEDRIDVITQHWDVIMRTLTRLQSVVATNLFTQLKTIDVSSPDLLSNSASSRLTRAPSFSGRRSDEYASKPGKTNMKFISLLPNCLAGDKQIKAEVDAARARIVSGLRATRVVTGQNRWGIWREEARWVGRWAGGRDQGFFFFNLLTGFLSVHTDWLQALSPSRYRKQFIFQQKAKGDDNLSLPSRTIIVGHDRVAARRLIFLLSAFLPANQQLPTMRTHRPSTSASFGAFSQSPPSFIVPLTKEESLRRKINRRGTPRHSTHSRNASQYTTTTGVRSSVPAHLAHLTMDSRHERRPSDATSIRTANLPLQGSDMDARKSSAATTATITPETSIPHFTVQKLEAQFYPRPESSSSMAADDLKRSLARGDSVGQYSVKSVDSQQSSRWGSVISGFWSGNRRRDSPQTTPSIRDSTGSGRESLPTSPGKAAAPQRNSLGRMAEEAQIADAVYQVQIGGGPRHATVDTPQTPCLHPSDGQEEPKSSRSPIQMERKPDPTGAFESPVKTTINPDGVIDVDVPFPDFITSFETAVSSPSSSGYLSTPGLGGLDLFEQACRVAIDGDVPMNVAGWLQCYHPDFILQAIPPQNDLLEQVKACLRAEPTPYSIAHPETKQDRWVDVSSVLIADTTSFSIRRIRYRRLVRPTFAVDKGGTSMLSSSVNTSVSSVLTPMVSPYEQHLQDDFVEDSIVAVDDTLIDAIERVIAIRGSSDVSKQSSTCSSSRSTSKRRASIGTREWTDQENPTHDGDEDPDVHAAHTIAVAQSQYQSHKRHVPIPQPLSQQEIPRAECKAVVLSALETIATEVAQSKDEEENDIKCGRTSHRPREKESVLREAVRAWVEGVEAGGSTGGSVEGQ